MICICAIFKLNLEISKFFWEFIVVNNINKDKAINKRFFIYQILKFDDIASL